MCTFSLSVRSLSGKLISFRNEGYMELTKALVHAEAAGTGPGCCSRRNSSSPRSRRCHVGARH